jgi:membrane associated rhomboid family serine protease
MEAELIRIPAYSRRQAMDWSLVLVSQGIESTIDYAPDHAGWVLLIMPQDYEHAVEAIRLYRIENRRWPWRREIFQPGLLFDWTCLAWALLVCVFFSISDSRPDFVSAGAMDSFAVSRGQWWRLFTAIWLHADVAHLASNATLGVVLLGLAMGRYGTGTGLLAAYLGGALGNLAVWLVSWRPHYSLGASGMVMGSLGLLAVQSFGLWRRTPLATRYALGGILGALMLFVLLGFSPGTDTVAHAGGFVGGVLLGAVLSSLRKLAGKPNINLLSGLVFAWLVLWPWWMALTHTK